MTRYIYKAFAVTLAVALIAGASGAGAQDASDSPLVTKRGAVPKNFYNRVYNSPSPAPEIELEDIINLAYYNDPVGETNVGKKVKSLRDELLMLQSIVTQLSDNLTALETQGQKLAADYYANVATISTQLQSGTTPGNPRLMRRLGKARESLSTLERHMTALNDISVRIANAASMSTFLLNAARAAYRITGAVEEDHVHLAQLEDAVNKAVVVIERLSTNVNDDIARTTSYLNTERENMRTLALAISTGYMFRQSLKSVSFQPASADIYAQESGYNTYAPEDSPVGGSFSQPPASGSLGEPRPLVKIRFNKPDVAYEQPLYQAVNEALSRVENPQFELIAIHPNQGNTAEVAIASTRSRRYAERVLRSLKEMGMPIEKVKLSQAPSNSAETSEVHLYVR